MGRKRANKGYRRERSYCLIEFISVNGNRLFAIHHQTALPDIRYSILHVGTFNQCKDLLQQGWSEYEKRGITEPLINYKFI